MNESSDRADNAPGEWRLEYYEFTDPVFGDVLQRPIMTNGQCRVTALSLPGPLAHRFKYKEVWSGMRIEFEFEAIYSSQSQNAYQVFLGHALKGRPEYWIGSSRDNELLSSLILNIRRALCLLQTGPSDSTRIRTVEFVLSDWPHWKTLLGFQSAEIVR